MTHNEAAIGLYRKLGYECEGTRRAALVVDGKPVDEFWMAKLVSSSSVRATSRSRLLPGG